MTHQAISCNYARTALSQKANLQTGPIRNWLNYASIIKVVEDYNNHFCDQPSMSLALSVAYKRLHQLLANFNKKWYPECQKDAFLSVNAWNSLSLDEKNKHTLSDCSICRTKHYLLTTAFPDKVKLNLPDQIKFSKTDLASEPNFDKKALKELNAISELSFNKPIEAVLQETPKSRLVVKPSSQQKQQEARRTVREAKKSIQQSMDDSALDIVMSNRLSWRKFDHMRKTSTLQQTPLRK